jgi:hypothetical protein
MQIFADHQLEWPIPELRGKLLPQLQPKASLPQLLYAAAGNRRGAGQKPVHPGRLLRRRTAADLPAGKSWPSWPATAWSPSKISPTRKCATPRRATCTAIPCWVSTANATSIPSGSTTWRPRSARRLSCCSRVRYQQSINLFPFLIDVNALTGEAGRQGLLLQPPGFDRRQPQLPLHGRQQPTRTSPTSKPGKRART